jgi:rubrerythrin
MTVLEYGRRVVLENLQNAYACEVNARARYLAWASRADTEGLLGPANLFRAAAAAEEVHANTQAAILRSLGCEPAEKPESPKVLSTRENLAEAVRGEMQEHDVLYPKCIAEAHGNVTILRTFRLAMQAEANHAQLFAKALRGLQAGKVSRFYKVCSRCGYTSDRLRLVRCPACGLERDEAV